MPVFLHAACGAADKSRTTRVFASEAWQEVRMDADAAVNPGIVAPLTDMSMIAPESYDAIFTAHSVEHLYPHEVVAALGNFLRALKPDGYLLLTTADIQSACALVAEDKLLEPAYTSPAGPIAPIDILYGFRPALAAGQERFANRCGFTARALAGTLAQVGFASVWTARNPGMFTIGAIATRIERSEEFLTELARSHFQQG